jgi:hypothetical protein
MIGWEVYAILAVLLGLVFFLYLLIRRTVTGFKEGMREGK